MEEAALQLEIFLDGFEIPGLKGMRNFVVHRFFQRPNPRFHCESRNFDGPFKIEIPARRTRRQADEESPAKRALLPRMRLAILAP